LNPSEVYNCRVEKVCVMLEDIHILLQAANNLVTISVADTYIWTIQHNKTNYMTHITTEQK